MQSIKLLIAISLFAITGSLLFASPLSAKPKVHALLIGIGEYNDKKIRTLHQQPARDVESMKLFISEGFKENKIIHTLVDKQATKKAIYQAFNTLATEVSEGDLVLFYYSGHGAQVPNDNPEKDHEKDNLDEVIVNVDAYSQGGILHNIIRDDELDQLLQTIEDKGAYTKVIIDACHSGSMTKSAMKSSLGKQINEYYQQRRQEENVILSANQKRTIWTAAAAGQVSFAGMQLKNSIYTTLFIEAVNEKLADTEVKDGIISNGELHAYLLEHSAKYCTIQKQCTKNLTPTLNIYPDYRSQPFLTIPKKVISQPIKAEDTYAIFEDSFAKKPTDKIKIAIKHQYKKIKLNDEIFIELQSKLKGYLILLDINAKGEMVQIFPNAEHSDNKITATKKYYFPTNAQQTYGFFASEKGKSRLYAIITEDPIDLSDVLKKDITPTKIKNPSYYAGKLANKLNAPWTKENITRLPHYNIAFVEYTVY